MIVRMGRVAVIEVMTNKPIRSQVNFEKMYVHLGTNLNETVTANNGSSVITKLISKLVQSPGRRPRQTNCAHYFQSHFLTSFH